MISAVKLANPPGPAEERRRLPGAQPLRLTPASGAGRLAFVNPAHSLAAEQLRLMAGRLHERHPAGGVFVITSAAPGDGKTLTATNLAFALAERAPVSLLELDLRRPTLVTHGVGTVRNYCIGAALLGDAAPEAALFSITGTRLHVSIAEEPLGDPCAALQGPGLDALLAWHRKHFHWVVLDTPPALPIADVSEIARVADFLIMVVRARKTPEPLLRRAVEIAGSRLRYTILNDEQLSSDSLYKYARAYTPPALRPRP